MHQSTKRYGHEVGLSCAFRQWRAHSHCRLIHGYALAVKFVFEAADLDFCNWVVDFGSMKTLKSMLEDTFDHTLVVAEDDPEIELLKQLQDKGVARVVVLPSAGCEKFAQYIYDCADSWLKSNGYSPRCRIVSVEVSEHGANSAIFYEKL